MTTRHLALSKSASIATVAAEIALLFALSTLPTPLYHDYAARFHFSVFTLTTIYATYAIGTLSMLLFFGRLSDKIGRLRVSLSAIGLACLAVIVFAFARGTAMLYIARLISGLATGLSAGTATAWMRELHKAKSQMTATTRTAAVNLFGLGLGPLISGLLAAFAPWPMVLPYVVFLVLLVLLAAAIATTKETVTETQPLQEVSLKPRIGVPREIRAQFMAPAVTIFVIFSLAGFYSAITPNLISETLNIHSYAISGSVVFELFFAGTLTVYATAKFSSHIAMLLGAGMMLPTLLLLILSQELTSFMLLLIGTMFGGISLGLGYRGSLEVTNQIAPADKRAELISSLFVAGNLGLAIPVIGIGVVSTFLSSAKATLIFASIIALLAIGGLAFGLLKQGQPTGQA